MHRDNIRAVMFFLHRNLTRSSCRDLTSDDVEQPARRIKHPNVKLDHSVADFYFELMTWVRKRRASKPLAHFTEAPNHLDWPDAPAGTENLGFALGTRIDDGKPYLEWKRPVSHKVDLSHWLLATGKYADEDHCAVTQGTRTSGQKAALDSVAVPKHAAYQEPATGTNMTLRSRRAKRKRDGGDGRAAATTANLKRPALETRRVWGRLVKAQEGTWYVQNEAWSMTGSSSVFSLQLAHGS